MDVGEWSGSGSGRFVSDVPCTEVLRSLDVTIVLIINYWKGIIHKNGIESEKKSRLTGSKAISYNIIRHFGLKINICDFATISN